MTAQNRADNDAVLFCTSTERSYNAPIPQWQRSNMLTPEGYVEIIISSLPPSYQGALPQEFRLRALQIVGNAIYNAKIVGAHEERAAIRQLAEKILKDTGHEGARIVILEIDERNGPQPADLL